MVVFFLTVSNNAMWLKKKFKNILKGAASGWIEQGGFMRSSRCYIINMLIKINCSCESFNFLFLSLFVSAGKQSVISSSLPFSPLQRE